MFNEIESVERGKKGKGVPSSCTPHFGSDHPLLQFCFIGLPSGVIKVPSAVTGGADPASGVRPKTFEASRTAEWLLFGSKSRNGCQTGSTLISFIVIRGKQRMEIVRISRVVNLGESTL